MNALITNGTFTGSIANLLYSVDLNIKIHSKFNPKIKYDLVVFSGGADINPKLYGENNVSSYYNDSRDEYEIEILNHALNKKSKIFGICRGLQLLSAVVYNLKLIQDINPPHYSSHDTEINKFGIYKVNSIHHQGLEYKDNLPFEVLAKYKNIVEGFIDVDKDILAVQFHPELIFMESFMGDFLRNFIKFVKS